MKYAVQISGGRTSAYALKRVIEAKGIHNVEGYFADTKGKKDAANIHAGEDQDTYRYIKQLAQHFKVPIWRVADGRNIWDVMHDNRCIQIPQQDHVPCSKELKAQMLDDVILRRYTPDQVTMVFGMDWDEPHRMERLRANLPCAVWFPLAERPFVTSDTIDDYFKSVGIEPPRLYDLGFEHNNCGGFCVRAGKAHFARLWFTLPDRYLYHENKELELSTYLEKRVTVLRETVNGQATPITLREFRLRLQDAAMRFPELLTLSPKVPEFQRLLKKAMKNYDPLDLMACGCFLAGRETSN